METYLYKAIPWPEHVRTFYSRWLSETGWCVQTRFDFDRFVAFMEERMGDFLSDQCLDHSGLGLVRKEDDE